MSSKLNKYFVNGHGWNTAKDTENLISKVSGNPCMLEFPLQFQNMTEFVKQNVASNNSNISFYYFARNRFFLVFF